MKWKNKIWKEIVLRYGMSGKPTYYLWKNASGPEDKIEEQKERLLKHGFRVTILNNGSTSKDINNGIKALLNYHIDDMEKI